jgi:hypothetical protein
VNIASLLAVFWTMQVLANVAFKCGSSGGKAVSWRWLAFFTAGNIVGASSIWFLMLIYGAMPDNPNVAAVLAGSGGFIGSQTVLAWLFKSRLSRVQWAGILLVALGTAVATLGQAAAIQ